MSNKYILDKFRELLKSDFDKAQYILLSYIKKFEEKKGSDKKHIKYTKYFLDFVVKFLLECDFNIDSIKNIKKQFKNFNKTDKVSRNYFISANEIISNYIEEIKIQNENAFDKEIIKNIEDLEKRLNKNILDKISKYSEKYKEDFNLYNKYVLGNLYIAIKTTNELYIPFLRSFVSLFTALQTMKKMSIKKIYNIVNKYNEWRMSEINRHDMKSYEFSSFINNIKDLNNLKENDVYESAYLPFMFLNK